jgi:hypothetical protein
LSAAGGENSTSGTANTGGGGGGHIYANLNGGNYATNIDGQSGGSGIVVIRCADSVTASATTGSPTVTTSGGYRYYYFTSSGTITF